MRSRDSPKVGIKGACIRRRPINLLSKATVHSMENAGTAYKSAGTRPRNATSAKGNLHSGRTNENKGGNVSNGGSN
jgi:hypothetical protein